MKLTRIFLGIGVLGLALTGCTAAPAAEPSPTPTVEPISAETTCTQYSNTTGSLLRNASSDFDLGLTTEVEKEEMIADAYAKLRAVEAEPGSELDDRLTALEEFPLEDYPRTLSPEGAWSDAVAALQLSCENAGAEFYVNVWNDVEG